tara:strand:+ start:89 stop:274 length:186 start_codon:yes stop_codon:yes gene_type:complete
MSKRDVDDMRYDLAEREAQNMNIADIINLLVDGFEGLDNISDLEIEEEWNELFGDNNENNK